MASSGIRRWVHLPDWSPCHLVCHFSTSLRLPSLQMASFARAISCMFDKQVSSLRSWKVSFLSFANKSQHHTSLCREQLLLDSMVVNCTCPDRSSVKQLQIYHARHQPSLGFPGATNVGHESSQSGSTLDGFGSRDLQVFDEAKPSIQLHTQILNALFPLDFMFPANDLSCRITPVILYHCFYFVVVNFSFQINVKQ